MDIDHSERFQHQSRKVSIRWAIATAIGLTTFLGFSFLAVAFLTLGGPVEEGILWVIGGTSIAITLLVATATNRPPTRR